MALDAPTSSNEGNKQIIKDGDQQQDPVVSSLDRPFNLTIRAPNGAEINVIGGATETINDVKQSVIESPETCAYTSFSLRLEKRPTVPIEGMTELGQIEDLDRDAILIICEEDYTDKESRLHFNRLRDLLYGPFRYSPSMQLGVNEGLSVAAHFLEPNDENQGKLHGFSDPAPDRPILPFSLTSYIPENTLSPPPVCLKSISLSVWHPPPHHLRLRGDLIYISILTLENDQLHITGNTKGFYINRSSNTHFDPTPRTGAKAHRDHSLFNLLTSASNGFKHAFKQLQKKLSIIDFLSVLPITNCQAANPWLVNIPPIEPDICRSQEVLINHGPEGQESSRDWNDELQSTREMPRAQLQDRILRERLLHKLHADLTDAAIRGAVAIRKGNVISLNPLDPPQAQMYIYGNLFFSKALDGVDTFKKLGGDEAARIAAIKDLQGVRIFNSLDLNGLCLLGTVVVDYAGERFVAQSIVPGIFRRKEESESAVEEKTSENKAIQPAEPNQIIYGAVEPGESIAADSAFHEILKEAAQYLHLAEHEVVDPKTGDVKTLWTSQETKGLLGSDGRRYLLDLYRLFPVDIEFLEDVKAVVPEKDDVNDVDESETEKKDDDKIPANVYACDNIEEAYPHQMTLLRPELIDAYWEDQFRAYAREKLAEKKEKELLKENGEGESVTKGAIEENGNGEGDTEGKKESTQEDKLVETDAESSKTPGFKLDFNLDVFTETELPNDNEQVKKAEENVRLAARFLRNQVIPAFIVDCAAGYVSIPLDGMGLTRLMHQRGINIRYLGAIAKLLDEGNGHGRLPSLKKLVIQELVVRGCKHVMRGLLEGLAMDEKIPICIAYFLSALMGYADKAPEGIDFKTIKDVHDAVRAEIRKRFRYNLPESYFDTNTRKIQLLREIALRCGIQLEMRDYILERSQSNGNGKVNEHIKGAILAEDILNIVPIVKESSSKSALAEEAYEAGRMSLIQGQKQLGFELLFESLSLHEQIYGILHPEVARCYNALAMIYYQSEEKEAAVELQRKAVVISERTLGLDSGETVLNYINLSLFEHGFGNTVLGLKCLRRALELWGLVFGEGHPDILTNFNNLAVMLQTVKDFAKGLEYTRLAKNACEEMWDSHNSQMAEALHTLAQGLAMNGELKEALSMEKDSYRILKEKFGSENPRTKESEAWLSKLTTDAVASAKLAKGQVMRDAKSLHVFKGQVQTLQGRQQKSNGNVSSTSTYGSRGHLNIDELVQYIESGTPNKNSTKTNHKSQTRRKHK